MELDLLMLLRVANVKMLMYCLSISKFGVMNTVQAPEKIKSTDLSIKVKEIVVRRMGVQSYTQI